MINSILDSVKKNLGIEPDYTAFDPDIIMHINSAFSTLHQLGLGPDDGFMIEDNTPVWSAFFGEDNTLNSIKSYVYLSVRVLFDPPQQPALLDSMNRKMVEFEWRLNVNREFARYPLTTASPTDLVIDGGAP